MVLCILYFILFYHRKQIEISCLLLQKLLSVLLPSYAFNKYSVSIERALHHPSDQVKFRILAEVIVIINYYLFIYFNLTTIVNFSFIYFQYIQNVFS